MNRRKFLARGGVTLAYYVLPLLPLLALNVALLAHGVIALVTRVSWWANLAPARWMAPVVLLTAFVVMGRGLGASGAFASK